MWTESLQSAEHPSKPFCFWPMRFFKYQIMCLSFLTVISDSELDLDVLDKIPSYYSQLRLVTKHCRENEETKKKKGEKKD